jgi:acetoin utilization deacetylase AcuC-like enzyme
MTSSAETRRTALLQSPRFRDHDTGSHPENATRIAAIAAALAREQTHVIRPEIPFGPAADEALSRVHDARYVAGLREFTAQGGGWLDADTYAGPESFAVAALAAGAALAAVDAVLDGDVRRAFVLGRPPGHHATPQRGMGFCLFNTVAIAAAQALARGIERVLIVDWDVHHGNGTQDAFYDSDRVLFCSLHQSPLYPGTGAARERGEGAGLGYTLNVPLPAGTDDARYLAAFDEHVVPAAHDYQPQLVLVSAGFDAHQRDPLANLRLTTSCFAALTRRVVQIAHDHADGRVIAILEGGYDPPALAESVLAVLAVLDEDDALLSPETNVPHQGIEPGA